MFLGWEIVFCEFADFGSCGQSSEFMDLSEHIEVILDSVVELRHDLHAHPELGYEEHRTSAQVLKQLEAIPGIDIRTGLAGGTGIVATLRSDLPGPAVALRADMDALPMEDASGQPWASTIPGRAHTCGHDGHTAALVGAAKVLGGIQDQLNRPVKFIFQPAEEGGAGAKRMMEDSALENPRVDVIFGLHGWPELEQGQIGVCDGPMMASANSFEIDIHGQGGHAAMPHQGHDPIVASAQIITALQSLVARTLDPLDSGVVSICKLEGGSTYNVIPDHVKLLGTIRALSEETQEHLFRRIRSISEQIAEALDCRAELKIHDGYPVTENDTSALEAFKKSCARVLADGESVVDLPPTMGAEDFSFYGKEVPANFWFLGVKPRGATTQANLHQPAYEFPDVMLEPAIRLHCATVMEFAGP